MTIRSKKTFGISVFLKHGKILENQVIAPAISLFGDLRKTTLSGLERWYNHL